VSGRDTKEETEPALKEEESVAIISITRRALKVTPIWVRIKSEPALGHERLCRMIYRDLPR
jgi:hypothetical protein